MASAAVLLVGCQRTATEEALIDKGQETAFLPDCASLRVGYARQVHYPDNPATDNLIVVYRGSSQCMDEWWANLEAGDWHSERHGGRFSRDGKIFAAPYRADLANEGLAIWFQDRAEPGVRDISREVTK